MPDLLTKTERSILAYLIDYLREHTYQPSIREIGRRFGIKSTKTVSEHLQALADKGYLARDPARSRGVRILGLDLHPDLVMVPYYGEVAAGEHALAREHIQAEFALDRELAGSPDGFFLRVQGDSMRDLGIFEGDFVLVEPAPAEEVPDGAVVAVRYEGRALVKQLFASGGSVVLESASTDVAPIVVDDGRDIRILGRVIGLFRRMDVAPAGAPATG